MKAFRLILLNPSLQTVLVKYLKFGVVGTSGVAVDMVVLFILADHRMLALGLSLSKACAAEVAIINNFIWNEMWTFGNVAALQKTWPARWSRLGKFNLICLGGIGLSVLLLNAQVHLLSLNIYAANAIAILLVSLWNFSLTLRFGWREPPKQQMPTQVSGKCMSDITPKAPMGLPFQAGQGKAGK